MEEINTKHTQLVKDYTEMQEDIARKIEIAVSD